MPDFKPFLVIGLALGGVYAMSGVGLVVLYRTTGVLNLFYGAVGALASLTAWELINEYGWNQYIAFIVAIVLSGLITFAYGWFFGPPLADRDPLVKAAASLGLALILLGFMQWYWTADVRSSTCRRRRGSTSTAGSASTSRRRSAWCFPIAIAVITVLFLNRTKVGTGMRALADNRDNAALLGIPVRKVEAFAWFGSGILFGVSGLLLASLVSMEIAALTFTLPVAALAAALIGRVESLAVTVGAAFAIGLVQSSLGAMSSMAQYRTSTPFLAAIVVLLYFGWRGNTQGRVA
jgi:branched-chain amino acid transport system permease protein